MHGNEESRKIISFIQLFLSNQAVVVTCHLCQAAVATCHLCQAVVVMCHLCQVVAVMCHLCKLAVVMCHLCQFQSPSSLSAAVRCTALVTTVYWSVLHGLVGESTLLQCNPLLVAENKNPSNWLHWIMVKFISHVLGSNSIYHIVPIRSTLSTRHTSPIWRGLFSLSSLL